MQSIVNGAIEMEKERKERKGVGGGIEKRKPERDYQTRTQLAEATKNAKV